MPGPWCRSGALGDGELLAELIVSDMIEAAAYDDDGAPQGTYILRALHGDCAPEGGVLLTACYLAAEDDYYNFWMRSGGRPEKEVYHVCAEGGCRKGPLGRIHIESWRPASREDIEFDRLAWAAKPGLKKRILEALDAASAASQEGGDNGRDGKAKPPARGEWPGKRPAADPLQARDKSPPAGRGAPDGALWAGARRVQPRGGVREELHELRAGLEGGAGRDGADRRGEAVPPGEVRTVAVTRPPPPAQARRRRAEPLAPAARAARRRACAAGSSAALAATPRGSEPAARRRAQPAPPRGTEPAPQGAAQPAPRGSEPAARRGPSPRRREAASLRRSEQRSPRREAASPRRGERPSLRRREAESPRRREQGPKERSRDRSHRRRRQMRARSSCSDSDEAGFHNASTPGDRSSTTQGRLMRFARENQGRLARKLLWKMASKVTPGGEADSDDSENQTGAAPAVVSSYHLRVLSTQQPPRSKRNSNEMRLMCKILDLLSRERVSRAMDFAAQHLKAIEQSVTDGGWTRARFLELFEEEGPSLVNRGEKYMMRKEVRAEQQLALRSGPGPKGGSKGRRSDDAGPAGYGATEHRGKGEPSHGKGFSFGAASRSK
ncbi:unnamed protein product, partial [Prorocentrum cordatum]